MTVSDFIVDYLEKKGVKDFFGYQGTMISYFVDAIYNNKNVYNHSCYNEQGAAFAACGYSELNGIAVAYATSGPGAVNLLSGIANAFFDSQPVIFITGQINTYEVENIPGLRQQGFQEIQITKMAEPITKKCYILDEAGKVGSIIEDAYRQVLSGRPGPVLIDFPMDIQRAELTETFIGDINNDFFNKATLEITVKNAINELEILLNKCKRPVIIVGRGTPRNMMHIVKDFSEKHKIPIVTSLLARDYMSYDDDVNFGFLGGAYGMRIASKNLIFLFIIIFKFLT